MHAGGLFKGCHNHQDSHTRKTGLQTVGYSILSEALGRRRLLCWLQTEKLEKGSPNKTFINHGYKHEGYKCLIVVLNIGNNGWIHPLPTRPKQSKTKELVWEWRDLQLTFCKSCDKLAFRKNGSMIQTITTLKSGIVINHGDIQAWFSAVCRTFKNLS